MPWESGPRGRPNYTRTRRENGRVIREYIGVGQEGQRTAEEDEARRRQADADREADRALADDIQTLNELADLLARAALLAAGYHRPNRGPGGSAVSEKHPPRQLPVPTNSPAEQLRVPTHTSTERLPVPAYTDDSLRALVQRAESGDRDSLPEIRRLLPSAVAATRGLARRVRDACPGAGPRASSAVDSPRNPTVPEAHPCPTP